MAALEVQAGDGADKAVEAVIGMAAAKTMLIIVEIWRAKTFI